VSIASMLSTLGQVGSIAGFQLISGPFWLRAKTPPGRLTWRSIGRRLAGASGENQEIGHRFSFL
ncbi:hypothetical protein, partial [Parasedimentitalea psychrophila]|uniref:hypothetical protein n=1 Tax=Parasedimentitalea psychrophila TaxID=2997337 RepID=UPI0022EA879C